MFRKNELLWVFKRVFTCVLTINDMNEGTGSQGSLKQNKEDYDQYVNA